MTTKTTKFEISKYLNSEEEIIAFLEACLEEGDATLFQHALGEVAKAKGMAAVARESGLGRQSLYKALSEEGNPALSTVMSALTPLGLRFHIGSLHAEAA